MKNFSIRFNKIFNNKNVAYYVKRICFFEFNFEYTESYISPDANALVLHIVLFNYMVEIVLFFARHHISCKKCSECARIKK